MVDSEQKGLSTHNSTQALLELLEKLYKELLFLDCSHLIDEVTNDHKHFVSPSEVDDLLQEAQARLLELIDDAVKPPIDFKATARKSIDSQLRQCRRSYSNQHRLVQELKISALAEIHQTPIQMLEKQEVSQAVKNAYLNLNQPLAKVIEKLNGLGDSEEYGVNEIADQENVTRQTIRNRRNRAYAELRQNSNLKDLVS